MSHLEKEDGKGGLHYERTSNSYYGQRHGISNGGNYLFLPQSADGAAKTRAGFLL